MITNKILNQAELVAPPTAPGHLAHKQYVDEEVASLRDTLGSMATANDAPDDGKAYFRQNTAWRELQSGSSGSGDVSAIGEIRLLPFRSGELPAGWYFCNGDRYAMGSPQGEALYSLSHAFKSDWGITVSGSTINLPNLFSGANGYFFRAVDNAGRHPGSRQDDAIRNITGSFSVGPSLGLTLNGASTGTSSYSGAFKPSAFGKSYSFSGYALGYNTVGDLQFDASRTVATADENRPLNIGMTPAIYLGV